MNGFSITVFLPDGEPDQLRLVTRSHWTGVGLMTRRDRLDKDLGRPEFQRSGVYVLLGPGQDSPDRRRVYIGEGNVVAERVRHHAKQKDFWTEIALFTKTDDSLDKADISYLESALIELAKQADRSEIDNTQAPTPPQPVEAKRADIDSFLLDMLVIFRLLGIDSFEPVREVISTDETHLGSEDFALTLGGTNGTAARTKAGFLVRKGSTGNAVDRGALGANYARVRETLVEQGVVAVDGTTLTFEKDYEFGSPSAAAAALYGGQVSGPQHWKRKRDGKSLKQIEAELLGDDEDETV